MDLFSPAKRLRSAGLRNRGRLSLDLFGGLPFARAYKDGDGGGSGDGDSGKKGGGNGEAGKLSDTQREEIGDLFDERFNKAIGSRLDRFGRDQKKQFSKILRDELQAINDEGGEGGEGGGGEGGEGSGGKVDPKVAASPEFKALQRMNKKQGDQIEKLTQTGEARAQREFRDEVRLEIIAHAKKAGVLDPVDLEFVADHFVRNVKREEGEEALLVGDKELPDIMKTFFTSDQGKRMIPAGKGGGSGGKTGGKTDTPEGEATDAAILSGEAVKAGQVGARDALQVLLTQT